MIFRFVAFRDEDIANWHSQVFAPADEVLTTPRLEFRLTGLTPSTTYKIRGKLYLHNLPVEPESEIYTVRTLDLPTVNMWFIYAMFSRDLIQLKSMNSANFTLVDWEKKPSISLPAKLAQNIGYVCF